jgi:hypothetical protein
VFRSTILQTSIPDSLRGRITAVHIMVVTGGPRIGDFEAGSVAALTTPVISVVSGGLACVVGAAAIAWRIPQLWRYRAGPVANGAPDARSVRQGAVESGEELGEILVEDEHVE